jgi:hypothetical protein
VTRADERQDGEAFLQFAMETGGLTALRRRS